MTDPGGADQPVFDPRHDARYQRGYQPGDAAQAAVHPSLFGPDSAASSAPAPAPASGDVDGAPDDFDTLLFDGDNFTDEAERSRRNPFITLLWVIGVVLPAGGLVLQWQSVQGMFGNTSWSGNGEPPIALVLQQFSYLAAPPLISAGILIIAGLLFWHASLWRAKRRAAEDA